MRRGSGGGWEESFQRTEAVQKCGSREQGEKWVFKGCWNLDVILGKVAIKEG